LEELTLVDLQNLMVVDVLDLPLVAVAVEEDPPELALLNPSKLDQEIMTPQHNGSLVGEMEHLVFVSLDMSYLQTMI